MSKESVARVITVGVLAGALGFVALRNRPSAASPALVAATAPALETPVQDAVYAMFESAKAGNVSAYVEAYGGSLKGSIEQSLAEQGGEKFAAYLRAQTQAVKGLAVQEPRKLSEAQARIQVEYVYQDRNETQWLTLDKSAGAWKITRIEAAQRIRTLVPYGTPVN